MSSSGRLSILHLLIRGSSLLLLLHRLIRRDGGHRRAHGGKDQVRADRAASWRRRRRRGSRRGCAAGLRCAGGQVRARHGSAHGVGKELRADGRLLRQLLRSFLLLPRGALRGVRLLHLLAQAGPALRPLICMLLQALPGRLIKQMRRAAGAPAALSRLLLPAPARFVARLRHRWRPRVIPALQCTRSGSMLSRDTSWCGINIWCIEVAELL
jgi:hypothetical protein